MSALLNPQREKFAQLVATGEKAAPSYTAVYGKTGRTAETGGSRLTKIDEVKMRVAEIRSKYIEHVNRVAEEQLEQRFLSMDEKRAYLRDVVMTPISQVDEESRLCQSADYSETPTGATRKIKMPDKLRAIELDAKLSGELMTTKEKQMSMTEIYQWISNALNKDQPQEKLGESGTIQMFGNLELCLDSGAEDEI